jgi:hypothetical protein
MLYPLLVLESARVPFVPIPQQYAKALKQQRALRANLACEELFLEEKKREMR